MDKNEHSHINMEAMDSHDTRQSKQRASVKWLLSKAFNNRVPDNIQEPFYRDHEEKEHLKPPIVGSLANAELYCLALANIYSDPNYHNLNHWNILQTLTRKGVLIQDPPDCALTETVLIQTNPIRMSAHMAVMEAMMVLYSREVVTWDRVAAAAQRFSGEAQAPTSTGSVTHEEGLLCWINSACAALQHRNENGAESETIIVPPVRSLNELCDGTALAALVSFYCPEAVPLSSVRQRRAASLQDCLHNLMLLYDFCQRHLPHNVFHMMPEDVTYMRGSMRQNLVVMLADLFNVLEIHPVKSVKYPADEDTAAGKRNEHGVAHRRRLPPPPPAAIPDLRADTNTPPPALQHVAVPRSPSAVSVRRAGVSSVGGGGGARSSCSTPENRSGSPLRQQEESFVVHKGRAVPTLSSVTRNADDRGGDATPAGRPSNWEESRGSAPSYAGRRSRRSSVSDDSQLTVENFGGSQDRLNFAGRNPEKELATVASMRKISAPAGPIEPTVPVRSTAQDARGSIQLFYSDIPNGPEPDKKTLDRQLSQPQPLERPQFALRRQLSSDTITLSKPTYSTFSNKGGGDGGFFLNNNQDLTDGDITGHNACNNRSNGDQTSAQIFYSQKEDPIEELVQRKKSATFGALPNTTTWQQHQHQQQAQIQHPNGDGNHHPEQSGNSGGVIASQLNNIRLKLEEKRRHIEQEKRKMELSMNRQRQQVGQQAFLQAVTREINLDNQNVEPKWMNNEPFVETRMTPDKDGMGLEEYQQSIAKMNSSLHDIQTDIARVASQQTQLQGVPSQQYQQPNRVYQQPNQAYQQEPFQQSNQIGQPYQQHNQGYPHPNQGYQQHQPNVPQLHNQYSSQHNVQTAPRQYPGLHNSSFGSTPHLAPTQEPTYPPAPQQQFYLHDNAMPLHSSPQRRTWAQNTQASQQDAHGWQHQQQNPSVQQLHMPQQQEQRTWKSPSPPTATRTWAPQAPAFTLHEQTDHSQRSPFVVHHNTHAAYQNGTEHSPQNHLSYTVINPTPAHQQYTHSQSPPPSGSPQHRTSTPHRQISLSEMSRPGSALALHQLSGNRARRSTPPALVDDMEPQNISFIGSAEDEALHQGIGKLNISSGTRTYRIPSPTRPSLTRNSFQHPVHESSPRPDSNSIDNEDDESNEKGFYISFDNEQPKRPKPPLRPKRGSPRKERPSSNYHSPDRDSPEEPKHNVWQDRVPQTSPEEHFPVHSNLPYRDIDSVHPIEQHIYRARSPTSQPAPAALLIENDTANPDPESVDEMEKKKERIMMLALQRRQRADEARVRLEQQAAARRQREELLQEQRALKKEEQAQRRHQILQQHKLKKAIEEAEREGKVIDKAELLASIKPVSSNMGGPGGPGANTGASTVSRGTKLRAGSRASGGAGAVRARPKTIHVDSGALELAEGMLGRHKREGSSTNLTAYGQLAPQSSLRRDYYRGSQDSLADRAGLYRESPVEESRVMSPGGASALGRRGSYKTSRERVSDADAQAQNRGRSKYSTYQNNFKTGRKSSSLMNLCDSGLGRATPPRRAPSPGVRALPSPSGPGSLPGGIGKRVSSRTFDDASSDISSTPSSMMDYSGPRLYKQPTTKSNRGIMLNAVEYCVFPGVVNREAKRRVLEEISRSESKHFLVLFRDAGCQFRALYSYCPDREEVTKLYGTGPKQVNERMFDKFFKYNSGTKCFAVVHTKHLTVTIDAFTIHNSLWQGKKVQLPSKKEMALVI